MFEGMLRHVGVINNTGKNVAVVFMTLPDDDQNCLVVDMDALPEIFQESIKKIIESNEAQQTQNLGDVLGRRMSPDGSNTTVLMKLHQAQRLQKLPVDLISLVPRRGLTWPLRDVLAAMKAAEQPAVDPDLDPDAAEIVKQEVSKFNAFANNIEATSSEGNQAQARDLIRMAEMLEADAAQRRSRAYQLAPELAPKTKARVKKQKAQLPRLLWQWNNKKAERKLGFST